MSVKSVGGSTKQFELYVFPSDCRVTKLVITVYASKVQSGMSPKEIDQNSGKWEHVTGIIDKPTTLHLTVPADTSLYACVAHTEKATQRGMFITASMCDAAFQILEIVGTLTCRNEFVPAQDVSLAKSKLPKDAPTQKIVIGVSKAAEQKAVLS